MSQLKSIDGTELNEYVINLLHKNNISTAIEFLGSEDSKLCKITNLPESQIAAIKIKLRRLYGPQVVDGLHYCSPQWKVKYITGIESLDKLIGNEFRPGRIYEICGYSATGKSLLCTTIALNFVQNHSTDVIYLDTKRDFSGTRMHKMLTARNISKDEIGRIMHKIIVQRCYSLRDLINVLEKLLEGLRNKSFTPKLVIVDSLPSVWYLFHGEDGSKKGKTLLTQCAYLLKQIAKDHQLLVICVNVMVRNINEEEPVTAMDIEDRLELAGNNQQHQHSQQQLEPAIVSKSNSKPSLGKCWDAVPTIRLTIEDPFYEAMLNEVSTTQNRTGEARNSAETMDKNQRIVRVAKSCFSSTGSECTITVADTGMH
ncbi:DNA repair protein RAD51 homolog 4 [Eupeodes corollae]|uniref:DNA repair protein RAD51 homolog 4 n=1 Tax=Eupeodes corollae TaxID=290404 RepID=UPI0024928821|nr:DNA repair protein RAD51 homolog 4 [Eupeodes corollae]